MRISDWSSDVCSSDLSGPRWLAAPRRIAHASAARPGMQPGQQCDNSNAWWLTRHESANCRNDRERWCSPGVKDRSEEHTSELQSLMRISYAVFCLKKKKQANKYTHTHNNTYR